MRPSIPSPRRPGQGSQGQGSQGLGGRGPASTVDAPSSGGAGAARLEAAWPRPDAYLDLLKRCLTGYHYDESSHEPVTSESLPSPGLRRPRQWLRNLLYRRLVRYLDKRGYQLSYRARFDAEKRENGEDWPTIAYTMVGIKRLDNVQWCIEECLRRGTPGDLVETGVWRGGTGMFMRAVLDTRGDSARTVWLADSFAGMPVPKPERFAADLDSPDLSGCSYLRVGLESVRRNFARFGLLDERVRFLEGWFADTLPQASIRSIAVLRLDGDLYESTMDSLVALYDRVSVGGFVIVDDYHGWPGCKQAVDEFRAQRGIRSRLQDIDALATFWQRQPE
jgi:O-methyltransferase